MTESNIEYFNETVKSVLQENKLFVDQNYLYHYTDIFGLQGIITKKELWLSERNSMNDVNDEKFIHDFINEVMKIMINKLDSLGEGVLGMILKALSKKRYLFPRNKQYIFSTSTERDLIHQWSYYGAQQSFCIEFSREKLIDLFYNFNKEKNFYYGPVLYTEWKDNNSENEKILTIIVDTLLKISRAFLAKIKNTGNEETDENIKQYSRLFHYFYSLIKQYGHYCENEYRFVLQNNKKPEFRVSRNLFVPYLRIPFKPEELISEIIIGPNNREDFSVKNLKYFLNENGLKKITVSKSKMRIR